MADSSVACTLGSRRKLIVGGFLRGDDFVCAVINGVGEHFGALLTLLQEHTRQ